MLDLALKAISIQLNRYMHRHFDLDEDAVMLTSPFDLEGNASAWVKNKLVIFLSNINKDTLPNTARNSVPAGQLSTTSFTSSAPLALNVYIIVAASFDTSRYQESLKYLSNAINCFQQQPVIDPHNYPEMSDQIEKLILEIENVSINDLSNLWGILGGHYIPSVMYKVRMLVFSDDVIQGREVAASSNKTSVKGE